MSFAAVSQLAVCCPGGSRSMKTVHDTSVQSHDSDLTDPVGRIALFGLILVLTLLLAGAKLLAQDTPGSSRGVFRPIVGAYVPTGDQRDCLKDAVLVGAQAAWNANANLSVTGSFGWAPSKDKITPGDQTVDAFQYDVGLELRPSTPTLALTTPFIGGGIGGRTYSYRGYSVDSKTNFDGYGALGFDVISGPIDIRVEGRDYVSRFQPLTGGGDTKTRNDLALFAGLGW